MSQESEVFNYDEFTTRNIGFVTEDEQKTLKSAKVFIVGVGGMGGVALGCLARTGIENFIIADIDTFEVSNLNRQIFSNEDTLGQNKVDASVVALKKLNPGIKISTYGAEWIEKLDEILSSVDVVINGCDDTLATLKLMRKSVEYNKTVIDAFASPLPSVYTVKPSDPRPEETFKYCSRGRNLDELTASEVDECGAKEIEYVMINSSSANHVVLEIAAEMISGKRKRISLAPMVWMTGCLMSYEAIKIILKYPTSAGYRGVFINPWTFKIEKPLNFLFAMIKGFFVRRFIKKLL